MVKYLIACGADVDSFEPTRVSCKLSAGSDINFRWVKPVAFEVEIVVSPWSGITTLVEN